MQSSLTTSASNRSIDACVVQDKARSTGCMLAQVSPSSNAPFVASLTVHTHASLKLSRIQGMQHGMHTHERWMRHPDLVAAPRNKPAQAVNLCL